MKKFKKIFEIWDSCSSGLTVNNLGYFSLVPCSVIGLLKTLKDQQFIASNHNHTINIFLFSTDYLTTDSFWLDVFCLFAILPFNKSIILLFLYMNGLMDFYRIQHSKSLLYKSQFKRGCCAVLFLIETQSNLLACSQLKLDLSHIPPCSSITV